MNVIFKTGVIAALILVSFIGIRFKQTGTNWKTSLGFIIKNYLWSSITQRIRVVNANRNNDLLKSRLIIVSNIFLLSISIGIKFLYPELFYYVLPCGLFLLLLFNMDWILKIRENPDFVGEAAIGYLIFIAYLLFIILFLFLITIYFKDADTPFPFL